MSLPLRIASLVVLAAAPACSSVDGGAVELNWSLRPASASDRMDFISCTPRDSGFTAPPVEQIRLDWTVGAAHGFTEWDCGLYHGVTKFDLPPGDALLTLTPVCATGLARGDTYVAPAPIERTVGVGEVVTLGAVELILQVTGCTATQPCICEYTLGADAGT
jgi:hypothetical protein